MIYKDSMLLDTSVEKDQQFLKPNSQHEVFGKLTISYIANSIVKHITCTCQQ